MQGIFKLSLKVLVTVAGNDSKKFIVFLTIVLHTCRCGSQPFDCYTAGLHQAMVLAGCVSIIITSTMVDGDWRILKHCTCCSDYTLFPQG